MSRDTGDPAARIRAINRKANTAFALIALVWTLILVGFAWAAHR